MRTPLPEQNLVESLKHEYIDIGGVRLNLQRTCRVPPGQLNSLPVGIGSFPVYKVSDFRSGAPEQWRDDGFFMPMYRQEAMWMSFSRGYNEHPHAMIVGAGNINAVSGIPFDPKLNNFGKKRLHKGSGELKIELAKDQNYLVIPPQPWIDGWKAEDGKIYQFVAAEMGSGETVEGQITGQEVVGGIQLIVYDPKEGQNLTIATRPHEYMTGGSWLGGFLAGGVKGGVNLESDMLMCLSDSSAESPSPTKGGSEGPRIRRAATSMGLGRGGEISQKIYPDPYGVEVWKEQPTAVEMIYLVSSEDFKQVTGYAAPPTPVTFEKYQQLGLPWFELYDKNLGDSKGSSIFDKLKPVGEGKAKGTGTVEDKVGDVEVPEIPKVEQPFHPGCKDVKKHPPHPLAHESPLEKLG